MKSSVIALDAKQHRFHGWQRFNHYRFTAQDALVQVVVPELHVLMPIYPLAFAPRPDGGCQLIAIQGLHANENLFVDKAGRWQVGYIPSFYRGYPFTLREAGEGEQRKLVLCLDQSSGLYRETPDPAKGEVRFFDDAGQPQALLKQLLEFLTATMTARQQTNRIVDALAEAALLAPWDLPVSNPNPGIPLLQGLYRIDETSLNALEGQVLESLFKANALRLAYAQLLSQTRVGMLLHFYDLRHPKPAAPPDLPVSLDSLFGEGRDDGTLSFEWLKQTP